MEKRPWGYFIVLDEGEKHKVKKLVILPKKRLSLQRHFLRSEFWVVVKGKAKVIVGNNEKILSEGEFVFIPVKEIHRIENPGDENLEIIEVQYGKCLEEDIERLEDDYGRK
jgi:mannose-1-phosphate guanylyltransferase/mannose-6-phosphate isomerase